MELLFFVFFLLGIFFFAFGFGINVFVFDVDVFEWGVGGQAVRVFWIMRHPGH